MSRRRKVGGSSPFEPSDQYAVEHVSAGVMLVRHYGDPSRPDHVCCLVKVTIRDEDRAAGFDWEPRDQKGAVHALQRIAPIFERRHPASK
jgi:hypothetical protein